MVARAGVGRCAQESEVQELRPSGLYVLRSFPSAVAPVTEPGNKKARGQRWKESPEEEPVRKKRSRHMTKNLDPDPGESISGRWAWL